MSTHIEKGVNQKTKQPYSFLAMVYTNTWIDEKGETKTFNVKFPFQDVQNCVRAGQEAMKLNEKFC